MAEKPGFNDPVQQTAGSAPSYLRVRGVEWEVSETPAPIDICTPTVAVAIDSVAYFRNYHSRHVYKYEKDTDQWSTFGGQNCDHPNADETKCLCCKCPTRDNTLVSIDKSLHTVGGLYVPETEIKRKGISAIPAEDWGRNDRLYEDEDLSDKLYVRSGGIYGRWEESEYPPMRVARKQVIAIFHATSSGEKYLIVAGGRSKHGPVKLVEVLKIAPEAKESQWFRASDLPEAVYRGSVCICDGYLYILGCYAMRPYGQKPLKFACRANLVQLLKPENLRPKPKEMQNSDQPEPKRKETQNFDQPPMIFDVISDLRHEMSVCVSFCGRVLALGGITIDQERGYNDPTSVSHIYQFKPPTDGGPCLWEAVSDSMRIRRCLHFVASFDSGPEASRRMMVVGGCPVRPDAHCIAAVEFGKLKTN